MNESRSIDSEVFKLPLSSFVLEPDYDYADIAKRLRLTQPLFYYQLNRSLKEFKINL